MTVVQRPKPSRDHKQQVRNFTLLYTSTSFQAFCFHFTFTIFVRQKEKPRHNRMLRRREGSVVVSLFVENVIYFGPMDYVNETFTLKILSWVK